MVMEEKAGRPKRPENSLPHENESLGKNLKMHKNGQKCLKKSENQQNGAQKALNSGLYLKILMPG